MMLVPVHRLVYIRVQSPPKTHTEIDVAERTTSNLSTDAVLVTDA
jgi:hypothetical protein